jgi:lipopolysaccharide/colanic/teichoic acid biosynthesis glycosyltransferase
MKGLSFLTYLLRNPVKQRQLFLMTGDALAWLVGGLVFFAMSPLDLTWERLAALFAVIVLAVLASYIFGLYEDLDFCQRFFRRLLAVALIILGVCLLALLEWRIPREEGWRFLFSWFLVLLLMAGLRFLVATASWPNKNVAFLGDHPLLAPVLSELEKHPAARYQVFLNGQGKDKPSFRSPKHLLQSLNGQKLHFLLVAEAEAGLEAARVLSQNGHPNLEVYHYRDFYELLTGEVLLPLDPAEGRVREQAFPSGKRVFDLLLAGILSLVFLLPALAIALIIRLTSKGPVLFRQEKVGFRGRPLQLLKFRSMVAGAEVMNGPHAVTVKNDSRITPFGKILRLTHMDELPQLLMILQGEMSFIGSRPLNKHLEERLGREIPHHSLRYLTLPGLTGWAQIGHPDSRSPDGQKKRLQLDLFYIRHRCLLMDAFILLKSAKIFLSGFGAR